MPKSSGDIMNKMIIVAFSKRTQKKTVRFLCRRFRHVAPIVSKDDTWIMYQFVRRGVVEKIPLQLRDLNILAKHGWKFISVSCNTEYLHIDMRARTCVQMTKRAIGLNAKMIQTPYALYKKLSA